MKYILAFSLLFVAKFTVAQSLPQATLVASSLSQLTGYTGSLTQANWTDAVRGGIFNLVDATGLTVDNGLIFSSGKAGKYWKRDMTQVQMIRAEWYNLQDDGTDQSSLLNSIVSAIPDNSTLALPISKTYNTGSVWRITKPMKIIGNGSTINYEGTDSNIVSIESSYVTIDGLTVTGNSTTYTNYRNSISTAGSTNTSFFDGISISHCFVSQYKFGGIVLRYVTNFSITDNTITNFPYAGILVVSGTHGVVSGNKISHITGLGSGGNNAYGIALTRINANADDTLSHDIIVTRNDVSDVPTWEGIDSHAGYNLIISNNLVKDTRTGIIVGNIGNPGDHPARNVTITGNIVDNENTADPNGASILIKGTADSGYATGTITGNVCIGERIQIIYTKGVTITGNVIKRPLSNGIRQGGYNFKTVIVGNTFEDVLGFNGAAVFQYLDSNSAFVANNVLIRGDRDTAGYGTINHYGFKNSDIDNSSNRATFGFNDFSAAKTAQYFGIYDPTYRYGTSGVPTYASVAGSLHLNTAGGSATTLYIKDTTGWKPLNSWSNLTGIPNFIYADGLAGGQTLYGGSNSTNGFTLYTNPTHNGDFIFGDSRYTESTNRLIIGSSTIAPGAIVGGSTPKIQAITTSGVASISSYVNDGAGNYRAALWVDGTNKQWGLSNARSGSLRDTFIIKELDGDIFRAWISGLSLKAAGLFVSNPTARFQITSGSSVAGTAPLKLAADDIRPGKMTTPEKFAVEVDSSSNGGDLFYTDAIATRRIVAFLDKTQTLTNKTMSGSSNTFTSIPLTTAVTGLLPVANGGTGTATPGPTAGTNISITGTWPNNTIAVSPAYVAKTSTYAIATTDNTINCTSGTFTVTLPTAVGVSGKEYAIVNSGSGTITIATTSSQTFTNITATPTTLSLAPVGAAAITSYTVQSNGANWIVTGKVKNE